MVSVIIPIYKVEKYIARCAETLMQQTLEDVEYIFVDDATPDKSMEVLSTVLAKYPHREEQIHIIHHEKNQGLPAARNSGLRIATGEYVFHCDSDDYVELDMLETLYKAAQIHKADIVWCDWYLSFEKNERYMSQPSYNNPEDALKAMLSGGMKYNVWNKLIKRTLYTQYDIWFPSGHGMGEDMTIMMLFACATSVHYVDKAFYHYVKMNTNAFTQVHSEEHFADLKINLERCSNYIEHKFGNKLDKELAFLKLEAKFPFLIMAADSELYNLWKIWFPEANCYIWQNKSLSMRTRFLQWMASKNQFWFVRIYYYLVIRMVYGIIYQ